MVKRRTAKNKGNQYEYDVQYSLQQWTTRHVTRTAERGYQRQYDIAVGNIESPLAVIECKRLKGISWNQLKKFYNKLDKVTPSESMKYIIFQSNFQPCLVFYKNYSGFLRITFSRAPQRLSPVLGTRITASSPPWPLK